MMNGKRELSLQSIHLNGPSFKNSKVIKTEHQKPVDDDNDNDDNEENVGYTDNDYDSNNTSEDELNDLSVTNKSDISASEEEGNRKCVEKNSFKSEKNKIKTTSSDSSKSFN